MPFQVVYTSSATRRMGPEDLAQILDEARERNQRLGITGMLLYNEGNFLQVLEGADEATVRDLYEHIKVDERHHMVITLMDEQADQRDFDEWTMGFRDLGDLGPGDLPEGYTRFMQGQTPDAALGGEAGHAYRALLHFRDMDDSSHHLT